MIWLVEIAVVMAAFVAAKTRLCRLSGCEIPREKFDAVGASVAKASVTVCCPAAPLSVGHSLLAALCCGNPSHKAFQLPGLVFLDLLRALVEENHLREHDVNVRNLLRDSVLVLLASGGFAQLLL